MKTIQCPSCGASPTNFKNCDFCGSLFVRYAESNISTKTILSNEGALIDFTFSNLEAELLKNLSLQSQENWQVTDVIFNNSVLIQVVATNGILDLLKTTNASYPGIAIHLPFMDERKDEHDRFLKLEESKLFKHSYSPDLQCHDYVIDFGNDANGAAYLVSKILITVEGIEKSSNLNYDTSDYNNSQTSKSGPCFIATATMGNFDHPLVRDLRDFRDEWVLKKPWGENFVNWYYRYGSKAAKLIEDRYLIKRISFVIIVKPLHLIARILKK